MPVQARARDSGLLHDLGDRVTLVAEVLRIAELGGVDADRPADAPACRRRDGAGMRRALHRVRAFHLREQRQQHYGELRHRILWAARVDLDRVSEIPHPDPPRREVVDHVQRVADGSAEAIEGVHDDDIALARVRENLSQARPVGRRAGLLVDVDPIARDPGLLEASICRSTPCLTVETRA